MRIFLFLGFLSFALQLAGSSCYTPASTIYTPPASAGTKMVNSASPSWGGIMTLGTGTNGSGAISVLINGNITLSSNTTIYVQAGQTLTINNNWGMNAHTLDINVEQGGTLNFGLSSGNLINSINGGNFNIWGTLNFNYPYSSGGAGPSINGSSTLPTQFYIASTGALYAISSEVNLSSSFVFFTVDGGLLLAKDLYLNTSPAGAFCTKNSGCIQAFSITTNNNDGSFTTSDNTGTVFLSSTSLTSTHILLNTTTGNTPTVCTKEASASTKWCNGVAACNAKVTSNCNYPAGTPNCGRALPIRLTQFSARTMENSVVVTWATALHVNTASYIIEKSVDGMEWKEIGQVLPKGDGNGYEEYALTDLAPMPGTNYYRLKEVNTSGEETIYSVAVANVSLEEVIFLIYPTPSSGKLTASLGNIFDKYVVDIFDLKGSLINSYAFLPGDNTFTLSTAGVYVAKLKIGHDFRTQKLVVQ